jgi:hypothetical protein
MTLILREHSIEASARFGEQATCVRDLVGSAEVADLGGSHSQPTHLAEQRARSFYRRSGFVPVEPELFELILPMAD